MDPTLLKHVIILVRFSIITVGLVAGYLALILRCALYFSLHYSDPGLFFTFYFSLGHVIID